MCISFLSFVSYLFPVSLSQEFFVWSVLSILQKHFLFYLFPISLFIFAACFLRLVCQFSVWLSRTISLLLNGTKITMRCEIYSILFFNNRKTEKYKKSPCHIYKKSSNRLFGIVDPSPTQSPNSEKRIKHSKGEQDTQTEEKRGHSYIILWYISLLSIKAEDEKMISFLTFLQTKFVYLLMH